MIAQLPPASADSISSLILAAAALMAVALMAKKLFWPDKPAGGEYVTKAQLEERVGKIDKDIEGLRTQITAVHMGQEAFKLEVVKTLAELSVHVKQLLERGPKAH